VSLLQRLVAEAATQRLAVNRKDGSVLVRVPAGEFEMGEGQGAHKVRLSEYWIGVYCVTNRQYGRFVKETGHRPPEEADFGTPIWKGGRCPEERLDHPVVCVSWEDAKSYADWAGLSLATEAQWERGARGPLGLLYPWGDGWDADRARHAGNRGGEETCAAWKFPKGASGFGTYQQSGNVWEWCADRHDYGYVVRGGCWWYDAPSTLRAAYRLRVDPADRGGDLGFRLARTAV